MESEVLDVKSEKLVFGQDNPVKKPTSLISHPELLIPSIESALNKQQIQPLINAW